jgi:hypothetical protein
VAVHFGVSELRSPMSGGIPWMFRLSAHFIKFFFSEVLTFRFSYLLSCRVHDCLNELRTVVLR